MKPDKGDRHKFHKQRHDPLQTSIHALDLPTTATKKRNSQGSQRRGKREPLAVEAHHYCHDVATILAGTPQRPWATTTHRGQHRKVMGKAPWQSHNGREIAPTVPGHEHSERPRVGRGMVGAIPKQSSQSVIEEPHEMTVGRIPIKKGNRREHHCCHLP